MKITVTLEARLRHSYIIRHGDLQIRISKGKGRGYDDVAAEQTFSSISTLPIKSMRIRLSVLFDTGV